jgi:hypothetical protein
MPINSLNNVPVIANVVKQSLMGFEKRLLHYVGNDDIQTVKRYKHSKRPFPMPTPSSPLATATTYATQLVGAPLLGFALGAGVETLLWHKVSGGIGLTLGLIFFFVALVGIALQNTAPTTPDNPPSEKNP